MKKIANIFKWLYVHWLSIILWAVALVGLYFLVVNPLISGFETFQAEVIYYIRLVVFLFVIITFGILRLYNAIVQNTRFNIKLKNSLSQFSKDLMGVSKKVASGTSEVKKNTEQLKKNTEARAEYGKRPTTDKP